MKRFLAIAVMLAAGPAAYAQQCANPLPPLPNDHPANWVEVACKAHQKCESANPQNCMRCGAPIPPDDCDWMIDTAFGSAKIDAAARDWLRSNLFCPVTQTTRTGSLLVDICPRGCFAADTNILATSASAAVGSAYTTASALETSQGIFALADESTLDSIQIGPRNLKRIVHGPEQPELYAFHLDNGKTLKVTEHHPMVLADGSIVQASEVRSDASFLDANGAPVAVLEITREKTDKEVFNVWTDSDTLQGHVIVAEGVLTGDLQLQADVAHEGASIELRR